MGIEPTSLFIDRVHKVYPNGIEAVHDISLTIEPGEVFGLVGPNGAGKTTLLKLISGLLFPQKGSIRCGSHIVTAKPRKAARFVGLMPDPLGVYTDVSALEYLQFFARTMDMHGAEMDRCIQETVETLELGPWLYEEVETLSAGWQRRLALARILMADVPILLLDEPAAGLDVSARSELLKIVRRLAETGRTIIVSSHILPELQQLADRFGIIYEGKWTEVAPGHVFFTRDQLTAGWGAKRWVLTCNKPHEAQAVLTPVVSEISQLSDGCLAFMAEDDQAGAQALRLVVKAGIEVVEFKRDKIELNELVLQTIQQEGQS